MQATDARNIVQRFFAGYAEAYSAGDCHALSSYYVLPAQFLSDHESLFSSTVQSKAELVERFAQLLERYLTIRFGRAVPSRCFAGPRSPHVIQTELTWQIFDEEDQLLFEYESDYTLVQSSGRRWKIGSVITRNELERFARYRAR